MIYKVLWACKKCWAWWGTWVASNKDKKQCACPCCGHKSRLRAIIGVIK